MRLPAALAALHGAIAVAAGAFAAHGLDDARASELLNIGARWEVVAALAGVLAITRRAPLAAWAFVLGGFFFAGSLYALAFGAPSVFGAVAPVGGSLLIAGWALLAWRELFGRASFGRE